MHQRSTIHHLISEKSQTEMRLLPLVRITVAEPLKKLFSYGKHIHTNSHSMRHGS